MNTNVKERKFAPLTPEKEQIVNFINESDSPLTLTQISAGVGFNVAPGTITNLIDRGLIAKGEQVEITVAAKGKANTYQFNGDVAFPGTGKAAPSEAVTNLYNHFKANPDQLLTVADVADITGVNYAPSVFSALVKRGLVVKGDQIEVAKTAKRLVNTYTSLPSND
jgi:hypothetical protein